jgi:hypothetical protein
MTGRPAFEHLHGTSFYEYVGHQPALNAAFNGWMTRQSEQHNTAIVSAYDFSGLRLVVDVGGGRGATLGAILRANPSLRGILFDLPHVVGDGLLPDIADVAERCQMIGGDLLSAVPSGGDCYLLKRVLMDRSDEVAIAVLRRCTDATAEDGRILVIEMVILPGDETSINEILDVNMLVLTGGRVRTAAEFGELFAAAGLRLTRMIPTVSPNWIVEGTRA